MIRSHKQVREDLRLISGGVSISDEQVKDQVPETRVQSDKVHCVSDDDYIGVLIGIARAYSFRLFPMQDFPSPGYNFQGFRPCK